MNTLLESFCADTLGISQKLSPDGGEDSVFKYVVQCVGYCCVCHGNNCYTHRCGGGLAVSAAEVSLYYILVL
jgi:hypothetical protein